MREGSDKAGGEVYISEGCVNCNYTESSTRKRMGWGRFSCSSEMNYYYLARRELPMEEVLS